MTKEEEVLERLRQRIKRNVRIDEETGCWLWTRRKNNQGYAVMAIRLEGRGPVPLLAHRVSLTVFVRPPEEGEEGAHDPELCPFRSCVAPYHLRWATRLENEADKRHPSRLKLREIHPPLAREREFS